MERSRVIAAAEVFGANLETPDWGSDVLVEAGFSRFEAQSLFAFLPVAFGRIILKNSGVSNLATTAQAKTKEGRWVSIALDRQPIFVASEALATACREGKAQISERAFQSLCRHSSELSAYAQARKSGSSESGGVWAMALLAPSAEELGYSNNAEQSAKSSSPTYSEDRRPWWKLF